MDMYLNGTLKTLISTELERVATSLCKHWYIATVVDGKSSWIHKQPALVGGLFMYAAG